ncbi:ankyrin repeat domain-containing protein [Lysobacter sp. M15]|uniref:DUF6438 domain-containing protein n=1 Tax=Lysobacter sp. M15 TaxID=2916837 RepID=UPI001F5AD1A8
MSTSLLLGCSASTSDPGASSKHEPVEMRDPASGSTMAALRNAPRIRVCSEDELLGHVPNRRQIEANRRAPTPTISYAYGTEREIWGFDATVRVDRDGRVVCHSGKDGFDRPQALTPERNAALASLRYDPFLRDGASVSAIVSEAIREQELPESYRPLPNAPLGEVGITLQRTGCYGTCPSYTVDVRGDGLVNYRGDGYVDITGVHRYRIPPADVARLVDSLRKKDLWSLRPAYHAGITDNPTYQLTLKLGDQVHRIVDYVGERVGMPHVVSEFEDEVDKVSGAEGFVHLSEDAVERLQREGFRFDSKEGAELLARATANEESRDNKAIVRLVELGAPIAASPQARTEGWLARGTLLEEALQNRRRKLVDLLIAEGALETNGKPDQAKLDAAFRAAIQGGSLDLVQTLWRAGEPDLRPALYFDNESDEAQGVRQRSPVTLLLSHYGSDEDETWDGMQIAAWLASRGCDLKAAGADGKTLLHIAAKADDAEFVHYLLSQGFDASTLGEYDLPALGSTSNEDVAMLLLEAGTDLSKMDDQSGEFLRYARSNHWQRVVEWLRKHPSRTTSK